MGVWDGVRVKVAVGVGVCEGMGVSVGIGEGVGELRGSGEGVKVAVFSGWGVCGAGVTVAVWQAVIEKASMVIMKMIIRKRFLVTDMPFVFQMLLKGIALPERKFSFTKPLQKIGIDSKHATSASKK